MNFEKFLPIESYTLTSSLGIDEILKRVSESAEPKKAFGFSFYNNHPAKPYQGKISGNTFQINRIIKNRNSFLPYITGNISSNLGHSFIKIKMRPFKPVIVFMCFWLSFMGKPFLSFLLNAFSTSKEATLKNFFTSGVYIFLLMFLFGWFLMFFAFKSESKISKQFLASLLEGRETDDSLNNPY